MHHHIKQVSFLSVSQIDIVSVPTSANDGEGERACEVSESDSDSDSDSDGVKATGVHFASLHSASRACE